MSEVKDNLRSGVGEGWIKVGAARCEKCWLEKLRMLTHYHFADVSKMVGIVERIYNEQR